MGSKKVSKSSRTSKKEVKNRIELKKENIQKYGSSIRIAKISRMLKKLPSTITFLVMKKRIINESVRKINVSNGLWGDIRYKIILKSVLKKNSNTINCIIIIDKTWQKVTSRTMNSASKKLWPNCAPGRYFQGF